MEIVIFVVCLVFCVISIPFNKMIKRRVPSKWQTITQLFVYWILFMLLYWIAALLGFPVWNK